MNVNSSSSLISKQKATRGSVFTEAPKKANLGEINEPERCSSPSKKVRPTMGSDLQKYIDKIRQKDDKIETRKGFSNSATTRKLQSAFRSIKCL